MLRPLYHLSQHAGEEVDYVPFDGSGFVDPGEIRRRIRPNTKLVIVNHGSNVIGTLQPIKDIGRICREHGVPFAIDASQTAGQTPLDLQESNVDVIAFTGHKSLMGPTGNRRIVCRGKCLDSSDPCRWNRRPFGESVIPRSTLIGWNSEPRTSWA